MPLAGAGILTTDHVPEFDRLVVTFPPTGRGEGLTVRTEGHGLNLAAMPIESCGPLAAGYVPEFNLPVIVPRGQHPAIRGKSHARGACPSSFIAIAEGGGIFSTANVPEFNLLVADRRQGLPARTESRG